MKKTRDFDNEFSDLKNSSHTPCLQREERLNWYRVENIYIGTIGTQ